LAVHLSSKEFSSGKKKKRKEKKQGATKSSSSDDESMSSYESRVSALLASSESSRREMAEASERFQVAASFLGEAVDRIQNVERGVGEVREEVSTLFQLIGKEKEKEGESNDDDENDENDNKEPPLKYPLNLPQPPEEKLRYSYKALKSRYSNPPTPASASADDFLKQFDRRKPPVDDGESDGSEGKVYADEMARIKIGPVCEGWHQVGRAFLQAYSGVYAS